MKTFFCIYDNYFKLCDIWRTHRNEKFSNEIRNNQRILLSHSNLPKNSFQRQTI
jgi:hypothetical protein